jgi:hypothetical protein
MPTLLFPSSLSIRIGSIRMGSTTKVERFLAAKLEQLWREALWNGCSTGFL